jgi:hypothetical protein
MQTEMQRLVGILEHNINDFAMAQRLDKQQKHELLYEVVTILLDREVDCAPHP